MQMKHLFKAKTIPWCTTIIISLINVQHGEYAICISMIQMFLSPYSFYDVYIIVNTFIAGKSFNEFNEILINIAYDLCAF